MKIQGSDGPKFGRKSLRYSAKDGISSTQRITGTAVQCIDEFNLRKQFSQGVAEMELSHPNEGDGELVISWVDDPDEPIRNSETENTVWEVFSNEVSLDLRRYPPFADKNNIPDAEMQEMDAAIAAGTLITSFSSTWAEKYFEMRLRSYDYAPFTQPVIRKRVSAARDNPGIVVDRTNTGRVWTLAQINPDQSVLDDLSQLTAVDETNTVIHQDYEWVKKFPTTQYSRGYLMEVAYEWWGFMAASKFLYGGTAIP